MIKDLCKLTMLLAVLCGNNCLFGTDNSTPIYRGNRSLVEVKSADSNPSKIMETSPQQVGQISTTQTYVFDLVSAGQFKNGKADFTLSENTDGFPQVIKEVVDEENNKFVAVVAPSHMGTMQSPMGHNTWVEIKMIVKDGEAMSYMSLGVKKKGQEDFFAILSKGEDTTYVDMMYNGTLEFVPLVSSTEVTNGYTKVEENYNVTNLSYITDKESFDFGTTFRVQATPQTSQWLLDQPCDLYNVGGEADGWHSDGQVGIGTLMVDGKKLENQLLIINTNGKLARSSDGVHWFDFGTVVGDGVSAECWFYSPVCGNEIWCVVNNKNCIRRSINHGQTWLTVTSETLKVQSEGALGFGNGVFMFVASNEVYTSADADFWTKVGTIVPPPNITNSEEGGRLLAYKDNRWLYGTTNGYVYCSEDGKEWTYLSDELHTNKNAEWYGSSLANGYLYAFNKYSKLLMRSSNGDAWDQVISMTLSKSYFNMAFYNNRLHMYREDGKAYNVCLLDMDGTAKIEVSNDDNP